MRLAVVSFACAAAAAVTSDGAAAPEVDLSARLLACLRELDGDHAPTRRLRSNDLDDTSIRTAVQLWFSDKNAAEAKYGDISWRATCSFCERIGVGVASAARNVSVARAVTAHQRRSAGLTTRAT